MIRPLALTLHLPAAIQLCWANFRITGIISRTTLIRRSQRIVKPALYLTAWLQPMDEALEAKRRSRGWVSRVKAHGRMLLSCSTRSIRTRYTGARRRLSDRCQSCDHPLTPKKQGLFPDVRATSIMTSWRHIKSGIRFASTFLHNT